jgi:asparagine synthase (glutamine-hydrolysing)
MGPITGRRCLRQESARPMPGLFGILAKSGSTESRLLSLGRRMADSMQVQPWLATDPWVTPRFCGGRVYLTGSSATSQPGLGADGHRVWFDGEFYPESEESGRVPSPSEVLEWVGNAPSRLASVDGAYALAVFDESNNEITLATDRLGYRTLYFTETADWIAYASEVKALLAVLTSVPPLDKVGLRQLFAFDYLFGERTLWKGISLLPPASLWTVSATQRREQSYWSFDEIHKDLRPSGEVRQEFGRLWKRAIARRQRRGTMPLLLSGGLDSRSVLAELMRQEADVVTVTFGDRHSPDVRIAERVSRLAGVPHRSLHPGAASWLESCEEAIWQTDGMVNAKHLPAALARAALHVGNCYTIKHSSANVLLGGHSLRVGEMEVWPDGVREQLVRRFKKNPFFDLNEVVELTIPDCTAAMRGPSPVAFAMTQGQRRWTLTGCLALLTHCEVVNPCIDLEMLHLTVGSLDDRYRLNDQFYTRFLVDNYPRYFKNVPWQRTGRGLAESPPVRIGRNLSHGILHQLGRPAAPQPFFDYVALLEDSCLLDNLRGGTLLADDVLDGAASRHVKSIPLTGDSVGSLLNVFTLETYLRQVEGAPRLLA